MNPCSGVRVSRTGRMRATNSDLDAPPLPVIAAAAGSHFVIRIDELGAREGKDGVGIQAPVRLQRLDHCDSPRNAEPGIVGGHQRVDIGLSMQNIQQEIRHSISAIEDVFGPNVEYNDWVERLRRLGLIAW